MVHYSWTIDDWRAKSKGLSTIASDPFGDTTTGIFSLMYSPKSEQKQQFLHGLYAQMLRAPEGIDPLKIQIEIIQQWSCPLVGWKENQFWIRVGIGFYHGVVGLKMFSLDAVESKLDSASDSLTVSIDLIFITPEILSASMTCGEIEEKKQVALDPLLLEKLRGFGVKDIEQTSAALTKLGVHEEDDFEFLTKEDLLNAGVTLVSVRKIEKAVKLQKVEIDSKKQCTVT
jgi:hypothetical protein